MQDFKVQMQLFENGFASKVTVEDCVGILEDFHSPIALAIGQAFDDIRSLPGDIISKTSNKVRGQQVTEYVWANVQASLEGVDEIRFCNKLKFLKMIVANKIVIRFKRLTDKLLAISEDTDQALKWFSGQPLDGIPSHLTRLTIGYRATPDWLTCTDCYLTYQYSFYDLAWANTFPIFNAADRADKDDAPEHGLPPITLDPVVLPARSLDAVEKRELA